ncbi:hypothetical protein FRC01_001722 [Tulasnella sp. 417]|nr:hypothetical protein FRC01_001722 [Tulasnella sp. 417]
MDNRLVFYANTTVAEAPGSQLVDLQLDNNNKNGAVYTRSLRKDVVSRAVFINSFPILAAAITPFRLP